MKHKNLIIQISTVIFISACVSSADENKIEKKVGLVTPKVKSTETSLKLNNPALMNGSSFANYFQAFYKLGRFEDMLLFTSKEVISKYGKKSVLESYQKMNFAYDIKLKSIQINEDSSYTLSYSGVQFATNKIIRVVVINENDTVKLLKADFIKF